jgi:hypothetical protein
MNINKVLTIGLSLMFSFIQPMEFLKEFCGKGRRRNLPVTEESDARKTKSVGTQTDDINIVKKSVRPLKENEYSFLSFNGHCLLTELYKILHDRSAKSTSAKHKLSINGYVTSKTEEIGHKYSTYPAKISVNVVTGPKGNLLSINGISAEEGGINYLNKLPFKPSELKGKTSRCYYLEFTKKEIDPDNKFSTNYDNHFIKTSDGIEYSIIKLIERLNDLLMVGKYHLKRTTFLKENCRALQIYMIEKVLSRDLLTDPHFLINDNYIKAIV